VADLLNWEDMGKALAAFERTRLSSEAPFDRFLRGDEKAFSASQRRGWSLFTGKGWAVGESRARTQRRETPRTYHMQRNGMELPSCHT
jgi:cytochrome c peroxidase